MVRQGLPAAAVYYGEQILIEEDHVGDVGVGVHSVDQRVKLRLGRLEDDCAAVQQVVVIRALGRDKSWLARLLVRGRKSAVGRDPILAVVR